jgi:hypothetical protein
MRHRPVQLGAVADAQAEAAQAGNRVAPSLCSFAAYCDATNPPPPLKPVSPSSSPGGCCGGLRTTCAPTMSNLVPAALIPLPFALEPEPPGEGRSRPWSSRHRGVGAGPAGDGVVLLYFPCSKPSRPASSAPGRSAALHRAFFAVVSRTRGEKPPSPCCGPGHRAEAGPSLVSSLFVCDDRCPAPHRREPGMPVPPACLRRSGSFPLCRRA